VIQQLESKPYFLFLYLDALSERDPQLTAEFADIQVKLYAEYAPARLIDFLRASAHYNLEGVRDSMIVSRGSDEIRRHTQYVRSGTW